MGFPLPVPGFNTIISGYSKLQKRPHHWCPNSYRPSVAAVIPAMNEEERISYALASLNQQTYRPELVVVVDDGSKDRTSDVVNEARRNLKFDVEVLRNEKSKSKTNAIKRVAKDYKTEKIFVLDADTILESPNYIERVRVPHYDGDVASSFGIVKPFGRKDVKSFYEKQVAELFSDNDFVRQKAENYMKRNDGFSYFLKKWPVEEYRRVLYSIDQYFSRDAQMRNLGTTMFPVGCGVMYDRKKLVDVFDEFEQPLGDNLTNSEDIFIGFALCNKGQKNVQVKDVTMLTAEPNIKRFPIQAYLWGSSYLQSAYYFKDLAGTFRKNGTKKPMGRFIMSQLVDGLYPFTLAVMSGLAAAGMIDKEYVYMAPLMEFGLYTLIATASAPDANEILPSLVVSAPIRLLQMPVSAYTYMKVGYDILTGRRNWKK